MCKEFALDRVPNNSEILRILDPQWRALFTERLKRKSIRTRSGIAVITAITKPFDCPHGTCTFCPGGVRFGTPQSYTTSSPAASFGLSRNFDPRRQVEDMLSSLLDNGHDTSKVEMILLGGTILAMPRSYQENFVKESFDALNGRTSDTIQEAIKLNEISEHRCVGLTIETKPDWCREEHIDTLLSYGATRVEIGVQSLREEVLKYVNRGHTLEDTIRALQLSKDSCLKVVAHMMPGLPLSDPEKDLEDLLTLVNNPKYRPDMLKIYPTLLVEGTALYNQYRMGMYTPYEQDTLVDLLSKFKKAVPPWLRIMRIQREIPKEEIAAGAKSGNLRQLVLEEMERRGTRCRCIRCREVGHKAAVINEFERITLERTEYDSSGGREIFLSFEDVASDTLFGFLRLRIPSGGEYRNEIRETSSALVRELHVYGSVVPLGEKPKAADVQKPQHRGLGTRLLEEAERVSLEFDKKKIIVISAVGTKEYYRKRGYRDDGPFVSKSLFN